MGGSSGPASAGGYYMEQYAGKDMGGSSGSASETNRSKLFSPPRRAALCAALLLGALPCKLRMPSVSYSRPVFGISEFSCLGLALIFGSFCCTCFESLFHCFEAYSICLYLFSFAVAVQSALLIDAA